MCLYISIFLSCVRSTINIYSFFDIATFSLYLFVWDMLFTNHLCSNTVGDTLRSFYSVGMTRGYIEIKQLVIPRERGEPRVSLL